jgi:L-2-hydroxyglutarate oxidase LhgO
MTDAEVTIVGGGIVGLAIAAELAPHYSPLLILEQYPKYGQETSSRNSEVIHAGLYYPHGSLKARLCVEGKEILYRICEEHEIPYKRIGKIITATRPEELGELERLYRHGLNNGVDLQYLTPEEVKQLEPNVRSFGGIFSPSTGIVSAHALMDFFYRKAKDSGADLVTGCKVVGIEKQGSEFVMAVTEHGSLSAGESLTSRYLINAAGLESDTVAHLAGIDTATKGLQLHWAKGSYFAVRGSKRGIVSHLIYPMPPKESLGIHAVIDLAGGLRFGPDVEYLRERRLEYGVDEKKLPEFGEAVRQIIPDLTDDDLTPDFSGIRPKLQRKGEAPKDFVIQHEAEIDGMINLIGIDSPGLTASPAIAKYVSNLLQELEP